MAEVHQFLCPHVSMDKIVDRTEVLKEQLKRLLPDVCVEKETPPVLVCTICNNSDDQTMITHHTQGILICLGVDGLGVWWYCDREPTYVCYSTRQRFH